MPSEPYDSRERPPEGVPTALSGSAVPGPLHAGCTTSCRSSSCGPVVLASAVAAAHRAPSRRAVRAATPLVGYLLWTLTEYWRAAIVCHFEPEVAAATKPSRGLHSARLSDGCAAGATPLASGSRPRRSTASSARRARRAAARRSRTALRRVGAPEVPRDAGDVEVRPRHVAGEARAGTRRP